MQGHPILFYLCLCVRRRVPKKPAVVPKIITISSGSTRPHETSTVSKSTGRSSKTRLMQGGRAMSSRDTGADESGGASPKQRGPFAGATAMGSGGRKSSPTGGAGAGAGVGASEVVPRGADSALRLNEELAKVRRKDARLGSSCYAADLVFLGVVQLRGQYGRLSSEHFSLKAAHMQLKVPLVTTHTHNTQMMAPVRSIHPSISPLCVFICPGRGGQAAHTAQKEDAACPSTARKGGPRAESA